MPRVFVVVEDGRRPDPFYGIPREHRHADLACAVVVEYLAGDLTVGQLDAELDYYLRDVRGPGEAA